MKEALVLVDIWDISTDYPSLRKDVAAFATYLNRVCEKEREKGTTIIHSYRSAKPGKLAKEIIVKETDIDIKNGDFRKAFTGKDIAYFCGTHFGRCIHSQAHTASLQSDINIGIALNLSMVHPEDTWIEKMQNNWAQRTDFDYYMWGYENYFQQVSLSSIS